MAYDRYEQDQSYRRNDRENVRDDDRGFIDRAADEVRSWFGDDEAERRRHQDDRYDREATHRDYGRDAYGSDRSRSSHDDRSRYGARVHASAADRQYDSNRYGLRGQPQRGYAAYRGDESNAWSPFGGRPDRPAGLDRSAGNVRDDDQHGDYRSWRDRQMSQFDRDYDEYRQNQRQRFHGEFDQWRQTRQQQRDLVRLVQEHQEVVGSDGEHIGTVDHVQGDRLKLAKGDSNAGGKHHYVPSAWISSVDSKVTLNRTAADARSHWRTEADDDDLGRTNLNRAFSGTY